MDQNGKCAKTKAAGAALVATDKEEEVEWVSVEDWMALLFLRDEVQEALLRQLFSLTTKTSHVLLGETEFMCNNARLELDYCEFLQCECAKNRSNPVSTSSASTSSASSSASSTPAAPAPTSSFFASVTASATTVDTTPTPAGTSNVTRWNGTQFCVSASNAAGWCNAYQQFRMKHTFRIAEGEDTARLPIVRCEFAEILSGSNFMQLLRKMKRIPSQEGFPWSERVLVIREFVPQGVRIEDVLEAFGNVRIVVLSELLPEAELNAYFAKRCAGLRKRKHVAVQSVDGCGGKG